jgi:hypothetical protein
MIPSLIPNLEFRILAACMLLGDKVLRSLALRLAVSGLRMNTIERQNELRFNADIASTETFRFYDISNAMKTPVTRPKTCEVGDAIQAGEPLPAVSQS